MVGILQTPRPLDLTALGLGLVAFLLHMLGTVFPYWWTVHEHDALNADWTFYYGIWVIVDCRNTTCVSTSSQMHGDRAWLIGPAVLLVFAAVLLFLVPALTCFHFRFKKHSPIFRKIGVIASGGAGAVIVMAVLIFYKKKAGLRPSAAPETSDGDPGWALFLSTCGAIVALVNAVIMGISVGRYSHKSLEKRRSVFGICVHELEVDVNALRRGELVQGKGINRRSENGLEKIPRVNPLPLPESSKDDVPNDVIGISTPTTDYF